MSESPSPVVVDINAAKHACDLSAVAGLLDGLLGHDVSSNCWDETTRLSLLAKARDLVNALESPRETMVKHLWAQPSCLAAITACYCAGVFHVMANGEGRPLKSADIASKVSLNGNMLNRFLKHIAAMGYIREIEVDTYAPTNFSNALTILSIGDGYPCFVNGLLPACLQFPAYVLQERTSGGPQPGSFQSCFKTEKNMFDYLAAHPPLGQQFNHHMGGYRLGRPSWMDSGFYPVQERLIQGMSSSPDAVLLVDIGGSLGHDLQEFVSKYPRQPGRLVLQDVPAVIGAIQSHDAKIELMVHDFRTEQPVKAARAYFLHSILHDWPDDVCMHIIAQVTRAMKPGYSKLLIHENIIPSKGADWQATALDIMMAALLSSRERTEKDWYDLLEAPELGLRIVNIWKKDGAESLIECELLQR